MAAPHSPSHPSPSGAADGTDQEDLQTVGKIERTAHSLFVSDRERELIAATIDLMQEFSDYRMEEGLSKQSPAWSRCMRAIRAFQ